MTVTPEQLEWIVQEVIRRLKSAADDERVAVGERSSTTADLRLIEKVITLRSLEGRLNGVTRVMVGPRAVVTPAVKDELKRRTIELVVMAGETPAPRT